MFVARMLSYKGTSFEVVKCNPNSRLEEVNRARPKNLMVSCLMVLMSATIQCYRLSSAFWIKLRHTFVSALKSADVFNGNEFAKPVFSFCQSFSRARLATQLCIFPNWDA